jgi:hypothetical protein
MGRVAGTDVDTLRPAAFLDVTATRTLSKAERYLDTGSPSRSRPSSTSSMTATLVTGFDIDAIRKIVVERIGRLAPASW